MYNNLQKSIELMKVLCYNCLHKEMKLENLRKKVLNSHDDKI